MHRSVPMGRLVEWIEPHRLRGIVTLTGDERPVISPSDQRHRGTWWERLVAWFRGKRAA